MWLPAVWLKDGCVTCFKKGESWSVSSLKQCDYHSGDQENTLSPNCVQENAEKVNNVKSTIPHVSGIETSKSSNGHRCHKIL